MVVTAGVDFRFAPNSRDQRTRADGRVWATRQPKILYHAADASITLNCKAVSVEAEARAIEQTGIVIQGALASWQQDDHIHIHECRLAWAIVIRNQSFNDGDPSVRSRRAWDVGECQYVLFVIPIVKDIFEEMDVGFWYGDKAITFEDMTSLGKSALRNGSFWRLGMTGVFA
jgi:hypothetical protein